MTITWTMFERVSEELAGGRQDDLVGANHLKAAGQRDVGEEAEMKIVTQGRKNDLPLVVLENGDQIGCDTVLHHLCFDLTVNITFTKTTSSYFLMIHRN